METKVQTTDDWKENEVGYCRGLVASRGDASVPYDAVGSYLEVQFASAKYDKRWDACGAIQTLQIQWNELNGDVE